MSDETNETSGQQPVDETIEGASTEGQTDPAAGPVADGEPASPRAAGEDTPSAPPADEAPQAEAEGSDAGSTEEVEQAAASEATEEAPAAEAEEAREPEEPPDPKKEEKKDATPGPTLEPIAIDPEGPELSAEERARL